MNIRVEPGTMEIRGSVAVLNVGEGDTKLTFDKNNPQECIRAARIVTDMIRRGYALLVEDPPGSGTFRRVKAFDENTFEYIIADFDPVAAAEADRVEAESTEERTDEPESAEAAGSAPPARAEGKPRRGRPSTKRVAASSARAVSVGRSAGG